MSLHCLTGRVLVNHPKHSGKAADWLEACQQDVSFALDDHSGLAHSGLQGTVSHWSANTRSRTPRSRMLSLVPTQRADPLGLVAQLRLAKVALLGLALHPRLHLTSSCHKLFLSLSGKTISFSYTHRPRSAPTPRASFFSSTFVSPEAHHSASKCPICPALNCVFIFLLLNYKAFHIL